MGRYTLKDQTPIARMRNLKLGNAEERMLMPSWQDLFRSGQVNAIYWYKTSYDKDATLYFNTNFDFINPEYFFSFMKGEHALLKGWHSSSHY